MTFVFGKRKPPPRRNEGTKEGSDSIQSQITMTKPPPPPKEAALDNDEIKLKVKAMTISAMPIYSRFEAQ
jgi:hypothetical protein